MALAYVCPEQYVVADAPKQSVWLWTTNQGEYLITGSGLEGRGDEIVVVSGTGYLATLRENLMLGRVLQSARRVGGGTYGGPVEATSSERLYSSTAQIAARILGENDVTILGRVSPALETAVRLGRVNSGGSPINVIAHKSSYPNFGPCKPFAERYVNYYLFDSTQPQGAMVIVRRRDGNEIISGPLVTGTGGRSHEGHRRGAASSSA